MEASCTEGNQNVSLFSILIFVRCADKPKKAKEHAGKIFKDEAILETIPQYTGSDYMMVDPSCKCRHVSNVVFGYHLLVIVHWHLQCCQLRHRCCDCDRYLHIRYCQRELTQTANFAMSDVNLTEAVSKTTILCLLDETSMYFARLNF